MSATCPETPSSTPLNIQYFSTANCEDCLDCGGDVKNSSCVVYTGPNLSCSTINSGDTLELAIQKINDRLCAAAGNYSTYNTFCLPDFQGSPITTQKQFVETISEYVCNLRTDFDFFTDTTYANFVTSITNQVNSIINPNIVCNYAGVFSGDNLTQILTKYCNRITIIGEDIDDIRFADWSQCFPTVIPSVFTLTDAFNVVLDQICATKALVTNSQLPVFNNSGSCIGGTSSDTLVTTINALKTAVCLRPTFDKTTLNWGCLTEPSGATTNLQDTIQAILNTLTDYKQNKVTWSPDFVVSQTNPGDACAGITVELATPINIDRFVAATASDTSPGTLQDKLVAGTNVTLDFTTPTEVTINCTGTDSYEVKANSGESSGDAGFLDEKIEGQTGNYGVTLNTSYNGSSKKLDLTPNVNEEVFWDSLYNYLYKTPTAHQKLCDLVSMCPISSPSTVNWSYENVNSSVSQYANRLIITDVSNPSVPTVVLFEPIQTAATTLTGTLNSLFTTAGKVLEVQIVGEENNAYTSLEIQDVTSGIILTSALNEDVLINVDNKFTFTVGANKLYSITARTHPTL